MDQAIMKHVAGELTAVDAAKAKWWSAQVRNDVLDANPRRHAKRWRILLTQLASMASHVSFPGLSLYHATKWGIEGFCEAVRGEIAAFDIGLTMVEPGCARTDFFGRSIKVADELDVYRNGPVADFRMFVSGEVPMPDLYRGDLTKIARAIIESAEITPAPRRLVLGSDAHEQITEALRDRLREVESQRETALRTDVDDFLAQYT